VGSELPQAGLAAEVLYHWYRSGYILQTTHATAT